MRRSRPQKPKRSRDSFHQPHNSSDLSVPLSTDTNSVDINTNLGEGYGHDRIEGELEVLPYVTSANIACGAHAGDPNLMEAALEEARKYNLTVGAHIAYPDLAGFGRREIHLTSSELRATILYQLGALSGIARTLGFEITQVRPHGFMYRQMTHDIRITTAIAKTIAEFDKWLVLIGPAGNNLLLASQKTGLRVAGEAWIDRAYDRNGNLVPHTQNRAIHKNQEDIIRQAKQLITERTVTSIDGFVIPFDFQTIHVHAEMIDAKQVAQQLRSWLPEAQPLISEPFQMDDIEPKILAYSDV